MTFAEIAFKNARKKFGSYLVYFFSTVFSVVIFYLFCCMYYNPAFEVHRFGSGKMNALFRASAIAVLLFAAVFTLYSSSYFIKTQKKEIAIYSLLGMRKAQIAKLMFLETFFIGLLAVLCGTAAGIFSSGYFTGLLMRFMAIGSDVSFSVKPQAMLVTAAAFCALFAVSGGLAYRTIYRYRLVELLNATKRSEGVPGFSRIGAVLSIVLLTGGYVVSACIDLNQTGTKLLLPVLFVVLDVAFGTYLLFRNLVPLAVSLLKRRRGLYYRTTNFISISQIAFRLKANSRMLAVVSLLSAVTITMISASYSLYHGLEDSVDFYAPYSYLAMDITEEQRAAVYDAVADVGEVSVTVCDAIPLCNVKIQNDAYALQESGNDAPKFGETVDAYMLSESKYLDVIAHTETPAGEYASMRSSFAGGLSDAECYFIDGNMFETYCKELVGSPLSVQIGKASAQYAVTGAGLHKYIGLADLYRHPTVVVSDEVFESYAATAGADGITKFTGFMFDDEMASANTVDAINAIIPARFTSGGLPANISYIGLYHASFALYGSYVFIGLFIGVLFLLAVGSVLYYKLIMEAQEEIPRHGILRKAGMSKREMLESVAKQLGLTYGIPLGVGLVHMAFALLTYNRMMMEIGQETPTLLNALLVVAVFVGVYSIFYAFSVKSYYGIVLRSHGGQL